MKVRQLVVIGRVALGAIFIYACLYKIFSPTSFAHQIYNYRIVPGWAVNPEALILPWLQLICGGALLINRGTKAATAWILLMMVVFQIALASALLRGLNIDCGCFKSGGAPATWWTFGRDFLTLLLAAWVYRNVRMTSPNR